MVANRIQFANIWGSKWGDRSDQIQQPILSILYSISFLLNQSVADTVQYSICILRVAVTSAAPSFRPDILVSPYDPLSEIV